VGRPLHQQQRQKLNQPLRLRLKQYQQNHRRQRQQPQVRLQAEKLTKAQEADNAKVYAGPAVRKLARELGVVLGQVKASGEHGRVMKDDVFAYVKTRLTAPQATAATQAAPVASGLPKLPDFSSFGGGEVKAMTRLQQVSVPQLSLNNFIPQVTSLTWRILPSLKHGVAN
jgi:pyruvate dehydrogenase E2 component (dihydrolipoamide acetyltransferase)